MFRPLTTLSEPDTSSKSELLVILDDCSLDCYFRDVDVAKSPNVAALPNTGDF